MAVLHPAPDYATIAIDSTVGECGGPLFLLDVASGAVTNLNQAVGLTLSASAGPSAADEEENWQVIGWHPDASHLLVTAEGQSAVYWVDIAAKSFERIELCAGGACIAGHRVVDIMPDGSGFIYIGDDGDRLLGYSFASGAVTTLLDLAAEGTRLDFPRISPAGISSPRCWSGARASPSSVTTWR